MGAIFLSSAVATCKRGFERDSAAPWSSEGPRQRVIISNQKM